MRFLQPFVALSAAVLGGCMPAEEVSTTPPSAATPASASNTQVARGLVFVEAQCSGCHAVRPGGESPNPQAPGFVAVANDMGFDQAMLREFFRDGHDTPAAMSIQLDEDDAEIAAAYIMSLRSPPR